MANCFSSLEVYEFLEACDSIGWKVTVSFSSLRSRPVSNVLFAFSSSQMCCEDHR